MTIKRIQGIVKRTPAQKAEDRNLQQLFKEWHPSPEELIASGEAEKFALRGEFRGLRPFVAELRRLRLAKGLTLADVSARCGIDQPALSRLENGHYPNPTLDTLWRYAAAVGKRLLLTTEEIEDTRPTSQKRGTSDKRQARSGQLLRKGSS